MPSAEPVIDAAATGDATRRLLSAASMPYLLVAAGVIAAVIVLGVETNHHISAIESWLEALGPWSLVLYILLYILLTSLLLLEVWAGYATRHIAQLAGATTGSVKIEDLGMVAGLVAAIVALVLIARTSRAAFIEAAV